jgi:hypothetical protein
VAPGPGGAPPPAADEGGALADAAAEFGVAGAQAGVDDKDWGQGVQRGAWRGWGRLRWPQRVLRRPSPWRNHGTARAARSERTHAGTRANAGHAHSSSTHTSAGPGAQGAPQARPRPARRARTHSPRTVHAAAVEVSGAVVAVQRQPQLVQPVLPPGRRAALGGLGQAGGRSGRWVGL